jgi:hypothetical protein
MFSYCAFFINVPAPCQKEAKVFGKGSGEQPFFRKVFTSDTRKRSVQKANITQADNDGKNDYRKCKIVLDKASKMRYYIIVYK